MASSCLAFLFRQHIAAFKSGQSRGADLNARNAFVPWRTLEEEKQTLKRNTKERRIQEEKEKQNSLYGIIPCSDAARPEWILSLRY